MIQVCPGAAPALVATTTYRSMELNWQSVAKKMSGRLMELNPWYVGRFFSVHQNQMFINVIEAMLRDVDEEIGDAVFAVDLAVFGHIVTTQVLGFSHFLSQLFTKVTEYLNYFFPSTDSLSYQIRLPGNMHHGSNLKSLFFCFFPSNDLLP